MIDETYIKRAMALVKLGPISKAELSRKAKMGKNAAARALDVLEYRGIVKRALFGVRGWRYALPAVADAAIAAEGARAARIREIRREICQRYRAKKAGCPIDGTLDAVDSWPVRQVIVAANEAPPMAKRGPASVWELAA